MRVLFRLFLRKFKRLRYSLLLGVTVLPILYKILKYIFIGIADEALFDRILQFITGEDRSTMLTENMVLLGIPSVGLLAILIWMYLDVRREFRSDYVADTLTTMHEQMLHFVSDRLKSTKDIKWIDDAVPELTHKWGLVDIGDWGKFRSRILSRIKKRVPKSDADKPNMWFKVVSVSEQIKKELLETKDWTDDDVLKVGEWLDGQDKGLSELRDKDRKWNRLNKTLKPYETDSKLRALIKQHKDYSYGSCSVSLLEHFMDKHRGHPVTKMLLNMLMGSPISKDRINEGLYKALDDIRKRMKILQKREKGNGSRAMV